MIGRCLKSDQKLTTLKNICVITLQHNVERGCKQGECVQTAVHTAVRTDGRPYVRQGVRLRGCNIPLLRGVSVDVFQRVGRAVVEGALLNLGGFLLLHVVIRR